ncbi:MAG: hypothetical protein OXI64_00400 [Defluviicoccus sp.]|nr:hypothetical protein [Defluviicoccus sp.]
MAQSSRTAEGGRDTAIELVEVSVVLVANQNDPSILNPDFLRYNGIVDEALKLAQPPMSTPMISQVIFEGDIAVSAEPHRFVFKQKGDPLSEDACVVPEFAERFVQTVSHIPYTAIGINAKSFRPPNDDSPYGVADTLLDGGKWMSFRDVRPDIHLRAVYGYEGRRITLDVGGVGVVRDDGASGHGLLFEANIHRDIAQRDQARRIERASAILNAWREDISDFNDLVAKFYKMGMSR